MLQKGKANILIDGQFGSTGKGLLAGFIYEKNKGKIDVAVTNAAPNAGHTHYDETGKKIVAKHLPMTGILEEDSIIYLNAGAVINIDTFKEELDAYVDQPGRVYVHPRAGIITEQDITNERDPSSTTAKLSSTQSGVGSALANKIMRKKGAVAKDYPDFFENVCGVNIAKMDLNSCMKKGLTVLIEVPQGIGLGLNEGYSYPYCTSRNVSVSQALADANVYPSFLGNVFMSLRCHPIRVGNLKDENGQEIGYSGPFYPDSYETTFEALEQEAELTTVTQRVRRIATFSEEQIKSAFVGNYPTHIFLNFANYIQEGELSKFLYEVYDFIDNMGVVHVKPEDFFVGLGKYTRDIYPLTHFLDLSDY